MKKISLLDTLLILLVTLLVGSMAATFFYDYLDAHSQDQSLGASSSLPDIRALFETSLASRITSTATSFSLVSGTDKDGNTLASSTYAFIIDEGTANEEFVIADCTNKTCTNATRGLSVLTGTTTVSNLKHEHGRGASVKITDAPIMLIHNRLLQGIDTFPHLLGYTSGTACDSGSDGSRICDIAYIRVLAGQGAATSTESTGGIVELGTALETASSTYLGVDRPTVLQTKNATDTPQSGCAAGYTSTAGAGCSVIAQLTGKIKQSWINLTEAFTFSGGITSTATTTLACSSLTGNACIINGVSTKWPSAQGTAGQVLTNDGTGVLSWASGGVTVLGATTTPAFTASTGSTTLASFSLGTNVLNGTSQRLVVDVLPYHKGGGGSCHWDVQIGTGSASTTVGYIRYGSGVGTFTTTIIATSTSAEYSVSSGLKDMALPGVGTGAFGDTFTAFATVSLTGSTYVSVRGRTDVSSTCGIQSASVSRFSI